MQQFHSFGLVHLLVLAGLLLASAGAVAFGRRWRGQDPLRQRRLDAAVAAACLLAWAVNYIYHLSADPVSIRVSLPLHVCDVVGWFTCLALVLGAESGLRRWPRTLLYFCGLGICTQAFFTPVVQRGPAYAVFWLYFGSHGAIVIAAAYDLFVRGYRPTWADWWRATAVAAVYVAIILPIDVHLRANYGYVGPTAKTARTLLLVLGDWPWRVPVMLLLAVCAMAVLMLPWEMARLIAFARASLSSERLHLPRGARTAFERITLPAHSPAGRFRPRPPLRAHPNPGGHPTVAWASQPRENH